MNNNQNKPGRGKKQPQQTATANGITLTAQVAPDGSSVLLAWQIVSDKDVWIDWLKFNRNGAGEWILPAITTGYQTGMDYNQDPNVPTLNGAISDPGWYAEPERVLQIIPFTSGETITYGLDAGFGTVADSDYLIGPRVTVTIP